MCSRTTNDIVSKFADLPEGEREALISGALQATAGLKWLPLPGPQTQAYFSEADILLYGGEAGGSKTDSGLGRRTWRRRWSRSQARGDTTPIWPIRPSRQKSSPHARPDRPFKCRVLGT